MDEKKDTPKEKDTPAKPESSGKKYSVVAIGTNDIVVDVNGNGVSIPLTKKYADVKVGDKIEI